jgi:hypothetical protein
MKDFIDKEPVVTAMLLIVAGLNVLEEFGVYMTEGQYDSIVEFLTYIVILGVGIYARNKVTPVKE